MTFDLLAIVDELERREVAFVLIGGVASAAHGSPSVTTDVDICYRRAAENLERLAQALNDLGARLRGAPEGLPLVLDAKTLAHGDAFTFATTFGDIDCLGTPAGTAGFDDLDANAVVMDFDGRRVRVASLDDLIRMKRAAGRAKDRAELEILGALRDVIDDVPE